MDVGCGCRDTRRELTTEGTGALGLAREHTGGMNARENIYIYICMHTKQKKNMINMSTRNNSNETIQMYI